MVAGGKALVEYTLASPVMFIGSVSREQGGLCGFVQIYKCILIAEGIIQGNMMG